MDLLQLLRPRFDRLLLKGFRGGVLNEPGDKFFAYALLSVKDEDFEDIFRWFLADKGFSYTTEDGEKYKNYNSDGSYTQKGAEQLVEEGIFRFALLRFYGVLFDADWYVLNECTYSEQEDERLVCAEVDEWLKNPETVFASSSYQPLPAFDRMLDFEKFAESLSSKVGRNLSWPGDAGFITGNMDKVKPEEVRWRQTKQPAPMREFIGQPWMVAHLRQEQKSRVNRAYEAYVNEAVFLPLIQKLKIQQPTVFAETQTLYHPGHYPLIYPHSKEMALCVVKAKSATKSSRLFYLLYLAKEDQLFYWTKPAVREAGGHHAFWIQDDIKEFSEWGNEFDLHEPSVTMDDPNFWQEHVFKQEGGAFLYLIPIE